jgi:ketosteroid isomerase-like protein
MPEEDVRTNTVQAWFEAFTDDPDAFRETLHPQVEWFPFEDNHSPSLGIDGAMSIRRHWLESWSDQEVELEDVFARGDNVVVTAHVTARGRGSGVQVDVRLHFHFRLRDGKVAHIYEHVDRAEALEAAGLSEQDAQAGS